MSRKFVAIIAVAGLLASCADPGAEARSPAASGIDDSPSSKAAILHPLGDPVARASEGFTNIVEVRELADGRVILTDSRERTIARVDLDARSVERIGRTGQGPGEYRSVFTILPREGGSFGVYDASQRRLTLLSASGEITGSERLELPPFSGFSAPRGPDADGWVYVDSRRVGPNGLERAAPLFRWNVQTGEADSLLVVMQYTRGQEGRGIVPMPRGDAWAFLADGSVARIFAEDYHVEWRGGARGSISGMPIPHERTRVGEAERRRWVAELLAQPAAGASISGSSGTEAVARPEVNRRLEEFGPGRFPEYLPAFETGFAPASPRGHIWLRLEVESGPDRTVFDLIDREGRLARRLGVAGSARVVGFGRDAVYLARKDSSDLEWLEKYPYPATTEN